MRLIDAHSWFPRRIKKFSGYLRAQPAQPLRPQHPTISCTVTARCGRGAAALDLECEEQADGL
jgi:hypothetical protein